MAQEIDYSNYTKGELLSIMKIIGEEIKIKNQEEIRKEEIRKEKRESLKTLIKNIGADDLIYSIEFRLSDGMIYNEDYVTINISDDTTNGCVSFHTEHKTKTMGCASAMRVADLDRHYTLHDFTGHYKFFTLQPENWKTDILTAFAIEIGEIQRRMNDEIREISTNIQKFVENN